MGVFDDGGHAGGGGGACTSGKVLTVRAPRVHQMNVGVYSARHDEQARSVDGFPRDGSLLVHGMYLAVL